MENRDNWIHVSSISPLSFFLFIFPSPHQNVTHWSPWVCKPAMSSRLISCFPSLSRLQMFLLKLAQQKVAFVNLFCSESAFLFQFWLLFLLFGFLFLLFGFFICLFVFHCCYVSFSMKQKFLIEKYVCSERKISTINGICIPKLPLTFGKQSKII